MGMNDLPKLDQITKEFGHLYDEADLANKRKAKHQKLLFQAFDEVLASETLGRKIINEGDLKTNLPLALEERIKLFYPGWKLIEVKRSDDGQPDQYVLEEDPTLMKHTYVNPYDKMVYGRTVAQSSPSLDDERLKEDHPILWERITQWPEPLFGFVTDAIKTLSATGSLTKVSLDGWIDAFFRERDIQRVLRDFNTLSDKDLDIVQEYMVPGALTVRLQAPRDAKEEELNVL